MALTKYEGMERVGAIWGEHGAIVSRNWDGGITLELSDGHVHQLDGNGHPTCHKVCKELETIAYDRKLLK